MTALTQSPLSENVVFFPFIAPPNGGKGTQTQLLSDRFNLPRVDMGSMLRAVAKEDSPLGQRVQERLSAGQLVSIEIVISVLEDGIGKQLAARKEQSNQKQGFILDGFPRNAEQTQALLAMCERTGAQIAKAFYLDVPYAEIEARAVNRRICADCGAIYNLASKAPKQADVCDVCGGTHLEHRIDDQPEKVQARLQGFDAETLPLLATLEAKGLLSRINGNRPVADITQELCEQVAACLNFNQQPA